MYQVKFGGSLFVRKYLKKNYVYCHACHTQLCSDEKQNSAELLLPRNQFEVATLKWHMVCSKFFQVCLLRFISFFLTFTILIHFYLFKVERLLIHDKTMTTKLMLSCLDIKKTI